MLHYNPQQVSSSNLLIFRRTNCIITASGIVALCKWPYSMPVESGLRSALNRHTVMLYRIAITGIKGVSLRSGNSNMSLSVTLYNTNTTKHRHIRLYVCVCVCVTLLIQLCFTACVWMKNRVSGSSALFFG